MPDLFKLTVPVLANQVQGITPGSAVKVAIVDQQGQVSSQIVTLDDKAQATATLSLQSNLGQAKVIVGPADATDEELQGLQQVVSIDVPASQWKGQTLALSPIAITDQIWRFWLVWCREFVITGKVLCANGQPVPGATVCAYDVDFWWWWWSRQEIGCTTTAADGSFSFKFRWCCGWWPWYWWLRRAWALETNLADKILAALRQKNIKNIPRPSAKPDLNVFQNWLTPAVPRPVGAVPPGTVSAPPVISGGVNLSLPGALSKITPVTQRGFDPSVLATLQPEIAKLLPPVPDLANLRLWPWFPWAPWFDCSPDIIFQVTQRCHDRETVIVNENVFNTRWDIPTSLNVTLQANQEACCIAPPPNVPPGDCVVLGRVCGIPLNDIGGNIGAPAAPPATNGYYNPNQNPTLPAGSFDGDRPFAGVVNIFGVLGASANADYYEFQWSDDGVNYHDMPTSAVGGVSQEFFGPTIFGDPGLWHSVGLNHTIASRNVIESIAHFQATHDPASWSGATQTRFWITDTTWLYSWVTSFDTFADGLYYLRLIAWTAADVATGNVAKARVLDVCDLEKKNGLLVRIDNRLVPDAAAHATPCGSGTVHLCTSEPDDQFIAVKFVHADHTTTDVQACANVPLRTGDQLQIDLAAHDPDGHLAFYTLEVLYGNNLGFYIIDSSGNMLPGTTLAVGGATGIFPAADYVGPTYRLARQQGATAPIWSGGAIRLTVPAHSVFPETCCYLLRLIAYKRPIVSCDAAYDHDFYNVADISFMVQV